MDRYIGTVSMGVRAPIIEEGDDLVEVVFDSVNKAVESAGLSMNDKDVVAVTESLVARSQGNYATIDDIAEDINKKFDGDELAILFPIYSRNRFAPLLKGFARSGKKLHICFSFPQDEVGNYIIDPMDLFDSGINTHSASLSEEEFRKLAKGYVHQFTGVDYISVYKDLAPNSEIHFFNDPRKVLDFTDQVLVCSIHQREIVKKQLLQSGVKTVYTLADILAEPINGSGFNADYGLLGSNLSTGEKVKLFPRDGQSFVESLRKKFVDKYQKDIQVMIYGDGAFKDPVGKIWELADPVVSPAYTEGLAGVPNEIKIKYIADNELNGLSQEERDQAMREKIKNKGKDLKAKDESLGTTPRQITDLLGSLSDLTSGSGDKGTPIVLIKGYFDNYATN